MNPQRGPGVTLGASYAAGDGYIDPPSNVLAYTAALFTRRRRGLRAHRVHRLIVRRRRASPASGPPPATIATERVVLTGGPTLAAVGELLGARIPSGGARHQVVVTEDHPDLAPDRLPMVFDLASGIYWRPEEGGIMWGMSNPDEAPGVAHEFDWDYYEMMRARVATLMPVTAELGLRSVWAATIDYTPDHLPILGARSLDRGRAGRRTVVAAAGGHGMMWGPGVVARRRPRAEREDRRGRRDRPRAGPLRRARPLAARARPDRLPFPEAMT